MQPIASDARDPVKLWRPALLALCALAFVTQALVLVDGLGAGGRPWFGYWDANAETSSHPFGIAVAQPRAGGASARAGLRDGDLVDLREQDVRSRLAVAYQPPATAATTLTVHRGPSRLTVHVLGSTVWEGAPAWKLPPLVARPVATFWFACCALLIALRRRADLSARILALVLICLAFMPVDPTSFVLPNAIASMALGLASRAGVTAAQVLLVRLSSSFGPPSKPRRLLEAAAYATAFFGFALDLAGTIGMATLWIDPVPFIFRISLFRGAIDVAAWLAVSLCAVVTVINVPLTQRARAGWLLLPLPVAMLTSQIVATLLIVVKSWFANIAVVSVSSGIVLLGGLIVTYALLKRRVLDLEFVLSRTLVVATVSLIIVAAFVLLEWLLGTVLAGVSHATGLVANAALALILGVSLNAIHKRVDSFIDALLFQKRRDDERALLDFSKEAAFVTDSDALLDLAMSNVRLHTDARAGALLLGEGGMYVCSRWFGEALPAADENDAAILALKTWHKPVDPHHYGSALQGALAVPMLARGRLTGLLVLGERAGGEAYAPDELEAISQFAHGVASALDALSVRRDSTLQGTLASISETLGALAKETASLRGELRAQLH